ncbi:hypothetical protein [Glycomyces sp. NRRL B-16210]|uniref:hypothetical protein n=1 Tax=Glycomyces sp. NRRL B-16210 TaxID=1463821 RepID=UPI0004C024CC|nr:hypothetical protein [Glycomyces sp. NRRL B-16210]
MAATTGPYAFVFWNDDLTDDGVLAQLREIAAVGFTGVTLSARIGLSRRVGYLTEEYFRLVRLAVDECARLGLAVMLYDEASYPSGSANGAVVERDPEFAARCLVRIERDIEGPADEYWRPALGRALDARLLAVVRAPIRGGAPVHDEAELLPVEDRGLVRLGPMEGRWRFTAVFDTPSGGTIRGAHAGQDDGSALAPPAADLLNPAAVQAFLETTHDAYARALGSHLGTTVVAMFTDEPFLLGRNPREGAQPYTPGLEAEVAAAEGLEPDEVLRNLPSIWDADAGFARAYRDAVRRRLIEVYYGAQARWCESHGIALTGHPAEPDDLATSASLHWPGQDTVWRWVLPEDGTALAGPESTAPKTAASAANLNGGNAIAEVLGAYGWRLTLDEAKWLLDWYLSRGVPTLVLHAFFYSVRGGRAYESEPDLGPHNSWWPHFPSLVAYAARVAALFDEGTHRVSTAVLADPEHVPDGPARELLEHQIDFFYLDPARLSEADIVDGTLVLGDQRFLAVVDHRPEGLAPDREADAALERFKEAGGLVVAEAGWNLRSLQDHLRAQGAAVATSSPEPNLRVVRFESPDTVTYACFNEGEEPIATTVILPGAPEEVHWQDPFTGRRAKAIRDGSQVELSLERRQTKILAEGPARAEDPHLALGRTARLDDWTGIPTRALGALPANPIGLGDWAKREPLRRFSGTCAFTTEVELPEGVADARLDLGEVGEAAKVLVNGTEVGDLLWRPYALTIDGVHLRPGTNRIEVQVSNSAANHYEGARRPSGLLGPVTLAY